MIRSDLPGLTRAISANAGLLLDRFVADLKDGKEQERNAVLNAAIKVGQSECYKMAYERWQSSFSGNSAVAFQKNFCVHGRLISGLGAASPLESGISLHHIYGVPWLPGSGLKGLAAHYCATVWGAGKEEFKKGGSAYNVLFGTTESAGCLIFYDGWWQPSSKSPFLRDVITTHHQDYYNGSAAVPTDFDSPIPITCLSVSGEFSVAVECRFDSAADGHKAEKWAKLGLRLLEEALGSWGFGGKTNAGYGRLISPEYKEEIKEQEKRKEDQEKGRQEQEKRKKEQEKILRENATNEIKRKGDKTIGVMQSENIVQIFHHKQNIRVQCAKRNGVTANTHVLVEATDYSKRNNAPTMFKIVEVL